MSRPDSPQFEDFVLNFETLYEKTSTEIPYTMFFTGDFKLVQKGST